MDLKNIKIEDPFWGHMQELVTDVVIPFQEDVLNDSTAPDNTKKK